MRKTFLLAALLATLVPACSSAPGPADPGRVVFTIEMTGVHMRGPDPFGQIADLQIPALHNQSDRSVTLRSVQLLEPPKGVRVVSVTAYLWQPSGAPQSFGAWGNLPKECPHEFRPHPVSAAVTPAHADSAWLVMLALRFSKPGPYYFGKARISYVTNGKPGWQDQNIHITLDEVRGFNPGSLC